MPIRDEQKISKQHAVPQNIMDVEFKIVGDLTMRQFFYIMVCAGIAYAAYTFMPNSIFRWPLILIFVGLGLFLAFIPVEDRGLDEWIVNFFRATYSPTQRVWRREPELSAAFAYQSASMVRQELITLAPTSSRRKLQEYLETSPSELPKDRLDIPESQYVEMVQNAFTKSARAKTAVAITEPEIETEPLPFEPPADEMIVEEPKKVEAVPETAKTELPAPKIEKRPETQTFVQEPERPQTTFAAAPMTPDRHSGRRFTSLLPSQGEIILPLRGERVIDLSAAPSNEGDIEEKTKQLKQLLEQIKGRQREFAPPQEREEKRPAVKEQIDKEQVKTEAQELVDKIKEENKRLSTEIEKLKKEIGAQPAENQDNKTPTLKKLEQKKSQAFADYQRLLHRIKMLQEQPEKPQNQRPAEITIQTAPIGKAKTVPQITAPNIISGSVANSGGRAVEGAVVIIKNSKGEPARALKTDALGQFSFSTPLTNGEYTIEVGNAAALGLTFDIMKLGVNGSVVPPIELKGKS